MMQQIQMREMTRALVKVGRTFTSTCAPYQHLLQLLFPFGEKDLQNKSTFEVELVSGNGLCVFSKKWMGGYPVKTRICSFI